MKKLLLCVYILTLSTLHAQTVSSGLDAQTNIDALGSDNLNGMVRKFDTRYEGVRGSPYLLNSWSTGTIVLKNGKSFTNVPVKIDLYGYEVISKRMSGDSIIVKAASIDKVLLTDAATAQSYTFQKWQDLGLAKAGYADVLVDGKYMLLADRKKTLIKANYEGAYSANRPYDEFMDEVSYYVKKPNQNPEKIKLTRKAVLEIFPDHQPQLKSFITKEQIDFREPNQVAQIFHYYHTLK